MIEVKSLKPEASRLPSTPEIYRGPESEAAPSRWPAVFVLAITSVAIYLKSIFPGLSKSDLGPPTEHRNEEEAGEGPLRQAQNQGQQPDEGETQPEDETGSIGDKAGEPDRAIGSGGPGPMVGGIADFMGIDSPAIDYEFLPLPRHPWLPVDFTYARYRAGNDNLLSVMPGGSSGVGFVPNLPVVVGPFPPVIATPPEPGSEPDGNGDEGPSRPEPPGQPRNRAPQAGGPVALGDIGICQSFLITMVALLAGTADADADPLSIVNLRASSGELTAVEGGWEFRPAQGYYGPVVLVYDISDGKASVLQYASLSVVEFLELYGTAAGDELVGTDCADLIDGREGNDTINARGGHDIVFGSNGNDRIHGGDGNDLIYGGAGDDVIFGGRGNDTIHGGYGNDRIHGEDGDDVLNGDAGDDVIHGGAGKDQLSGGAGDDELHGDEGDDTISGDAGDDIIHGGEGNDALFGGTGNDQLHGGAGDDYLVGGSGADRLFGDGGDDIVEGGDGDDWIDGGTGSNLVRTGSGNNQVALSGNGSNTVIGGGGTDAVLLAEGADLALLGDGDDSASGEGGDDRIFGEDGNDTIRGGDGNDVLDGGTGDDKLSGDAGNDRIYGGTGADSIDAGAGDDRAEGGDGDDVMMLGAGNDVGRGDTGDDSLFGGDGDDDLDGGDGRDVVHGGDGDDCLKGGAGDDIIQDGAGRDSVRGGAGDDRIVAALDGEDDCYDGGDGRDTLDLSQARRDIDINLIDGTAVGIEIGRDRIFDLEEIIGGGGDDHFTVGAQSMTLSGGEGCDTFTFDVSLEDADRALVHDILDFEAGDRIVVKQYRIRSEWDEDDDGGRDDDDGDRFARNYGDDDEGNQPFRFRIEKIGDHEWTFVDVYVEQQDEKDFSIEILGSHRLYYY